MCQGRARIGETVVQCEKQKTCYRCTATPSHYQSFFMEAPIKLVEDKQQCEYYWDDERAR